MTIAARTRDILAMAAAALDEALAGVPSTSTEVEDLLLDWARAIHQHLEYRRVHPYEPGSADAEDPVVSALVARQLGAREALRRYALLLLERRMGERKASQEVAS